MAKITGQVTRVQNPIPRTMPPGRLPLGMVEQAREYDLQQQPATSTSQQPISITNNVVPDVRPYFITLAVSAVYVQLTDTSTAILRFSNSRVCTHGTTHARITASCDASGAGVLTAKYYNPVTPAWEDLGTSAIAIGLLPGTDHCAWCAWIPLAAGALNQDIYIRVDLTGYDTSDTDPMNIQVQFSNYTADIFPQTNGDSTPVSGSLS